MLVVRVLLILSIGLWLGAIFFFAAALAPTAFAVLPTRELAGSMVNPSLTKLHYMGFGCGAVFLIASLIDSKIRKGWVRIVSTRNMLIVAMLLVTAFSQYVIGGKMRQLRKDMVVIDNVAQDDPRRVEFNALHKWSTRSEVVIFLFGLGVVVSLARQRHEIRPL